MMPKYSQLLYTFCDAKATIDWSKSFTDWELMSLRDDIVRDKDYVLVSSSSWLKLTSNFGGAPEIPIYQYFVETMKTQEDGSTKIEKVAMHDFNPIKVNLNLVELKTGESKRFTRLACPYLTTKFFMAQIVSVISDLTALKTMFVVRPYK